MDLNFEEALESKVGDKRMINESKKQNNLVDTTDCLEAVGVCRGWKNFFFIIILISLLLQQGIFWLVDTEVLEIREEKRDVLIVKHEELQPLVSLNDITASRYDIFQTDAGDPNASLRITQEQEDILTEQQMQEEEKQRVQEVPTSPDETNAVETEQAEIVNQLQEIISGAEQEKKPLVIAKEISLKNLTIVINCINFVLMLSAVLYCLSMLFIMKISLVGRLGGVNHICRAFFLSLILLVIITPWQIVLSPVTTGVIYTPNELTESIEKIKDAGVADYLFHYLRFFFYWLLALWLLIVSHIRSSRWTKSILRRLEVI